MIRIVIFGNSGSGKSTLARSYALTRNIKHLDLDEIAWATPGVRKDIATSMRDLASFASAHDEWVIEGCYGSLLSEAASRANEIIFLNPGIEICQQNCRSRPWEPHKYKSPQDQDDNLAMLLKWVAEYFSRTDEFSYVTHRDIFDAYNGPKQELKIWPTPSGINEE